MLRFHLVRIRWRPGRVWRSPLIKSLCLVTFGFCTVALGVHWVPSLKLPPAVSAFAPAGVEKPGLYGWVAELLARYPVDFTAVLDQGLPLKLLRTPRNGEVKPNYGAPWLKGPSFSLRDLGLPLKGGPLAFLESELALFAPLARGAVRPEPSPAAAAPTPLPPADRQPVLPALPAKPAPAPSGPPVVAIYHTHTSEDYVPSAGASHTYGKKAGIVAVGETLVKALKERGIPAVQDTTCHDDEKFREAYLRSAETAGRLLKMNPQLKMLLDVHRDAPTRNAAESRAMTTAEINGQKVARIYLIVGTDRLGLAHPNWQQNHAFALKLQQKLEALYPGLSRGIKIDTARFNQHLHPRALLVEIGGVQNTLAEAELGARYLADAIAALLPELN